MPRPLLLLVDDAPDVGHIVGYLCRRAGQDLVVREDAAGALDYLRRADPLPNLLLLDVNLPGRNGFDFFRELKQAGLAQRMAVALFTQITVPDAVARAIDEGIDFVLAKEVLARPDSWQERTEQILLIAAEAPIAGARAIDSVSAAVAFRAALQHPTMLRFGPDVTQAVWRRAVNRADTIAPTVNGTSAAVLARIDMAGAGASVISTLQSALASRPTLGPALISALRHQLECLLGRRGARPAAAPLAPFEDLPAATVNA